MAERDGVPISLQPRGTGTPTLTDRVIGVREAASIVGVRPSNFVRDWASRSDFLRSLVSFSDGTAPEVEPAVRGRLEAAVAATWRAEVPRIAVYSERISA